MPERPEREDARRRTQDSREQSAPAQAPSRRRPERKPRKGFGSRRLDRWGRWLDSRTEKDDPVYTQSLHPEPELREADHVLVRGPIDTPFLLIVLVLAVFGAIMAYSASSVYAAQYHSDSTYYVKRHIAYLLLAFGLTTPFVIKGAPVVLADVRRHRICRIGGTAASVLVIGSSYGSGATRWIRIGPLSLQPSEIAKMAVILVIALVMTKHEKQIAMRQKFGGQFRYGVLLPVLIFGLICALVMLEHHLSGIIIIGLLGIVTMFLGGTDRKWFFFIFGAGLVAVLLVLSVSDYARVRLDTWLNIDEADALGSAWQTLQGLYAIGSGGFFGVGLGNSRQKYGYVSQPQNDFIFTIICEELGFIGAVLVVVLFGLLIWRGFRIASRAPDKFTSLAAYGLIAKVALQTVLNIAVVTNSMPNTGISLPFFSSGGTSPILQIFEMGIVLNISRYSYRSGSERAAGYPSKLQKWVFKSSSRVFEHPFLYDALPRSALIFFLRAK